MFKYLYKFIRFAGDKKKTMIAALLFGLLQSVFEAFSLFASAYALNAILGGTADGSLVWKCLAILGGGVSGCAICKYFSTQFMTYSGYTVAANSRIRIADKLKYAPMGYFNEHNLGQITNTATNVAESLQDTLTRCMLLSTKGFTMTVVITTAMFVFDWRVGFVTLGGFALFLVINALLHRAGEKNSDRKMKTVEDAVDAVLEYVQGIAVIKSYNLTVKANKKVQNAIRRERDINYALERNYIPFLALQGLVVKLAGIAIIACAVAFYLGGTLTLANSLVLCIASFMVFNDLAAGGNMSALLRMASNSVDKINAALSLPVMDVDGKEICPNTTDISVQNVGFSYEKRRIIDNVTIEIRARTSLAIVGASGSGKTTLCNLILRFWDVNEGSVSLGGHDVREYKLDSLLKNYSMVFQNVYLFNDTVANNIRFGKPNASMEEVIAAAKKACCHDFIVALPQGYDTVIGEGGANISGGEKQRISIARAIIKDSPVIVMDEATANVDPENEWMLQNAIAELTKSKTVIIIAHRLKTVRNADKIIVLDNGKIAEEGIHSELMQRGGQYAKFVAMREKSVGWKLSSEQ